MSKDISGFTVRSALVGNAGMADSSSRLPFAPKPPPQFTFGQKAPPRSSRAASRPHNRRR
jgi:hypothetical protein